MKKLIAILLLATVTLASCGKDDPLPCPMVLEKKVDDSGFWVRFEEQHGNNDGQSYFVKVTESQYREAQAGSRYCRPSDL